VQSHTLFRELVVPEIVKRQAYLVCGIDNLRYDQWKTFESEVSNYYKLEKSPLFLYSSYGDPICSKRDFLWFDTTGNGKAVSAILEKRSRRAEKTYMKLSFISATKTPRTEHQRRLF
jgi:hypothetical protein